VTKIPYEKLCARHFKSSALTILFLHATLTIVLYPREKTPPNGCSILLKMRGGEKKKKKKEKHVLDFGCEEKVRKDRRQLYHNHGTKRHCSQGKQVNR